MMTITEMKQIQTLLKLIIILLVRQIKIQAVQIQKLIPELKPILEPEQIQELKPIQEPELIPELEQVQLKLIPEQEQVQVPVIIRQD